MAIAPPPPPQQKTMADSLNPLDITSATEKLTLLTRRSRRRPREQTSTRKSCHSRTGTRTEWGRGDWSWVGERSSGWPLPGLSSRYSVCVCSTAWTTLYCLSSVSLFCIGVFLCVCMRSCVYVIPKFSHLNLFDVKKTPKQFSWLSILQEMGYNRFNRKAKIIFYDWLLFFDN